MSEIKPWREHIEKHDAYIIMCNVLDDLYEKEAIKKEVFERLRQAPSTDEWTPCSERLPEIGEHYESEPCIVYCSNGAYGFAELEGNIFGQVWWNCERDDEYHEPLGEVVAWMPLPEPYERSKEENR